MKLTMSDFTQYACRKTLADSRPRVRGRFAKNDEYGSEQSYRGNYNHHEDDEDDEVRLPLLNTYHPHSLISYLFSQFYLPDYNKGRR